MSGRKDIHNDPNANTKGFDKNPQNINKAGRPKKIYTILKEKGYSADDIRIAFGELAFYTLAELKDVYDDDAKPVITRIIANQFYKALTKSDWNKVKEILEHIIGKPQSNMDVNLNQPVKFVLSDKQVKKIADKYDKEI